MQDRSIRKVRSCRYTVEQVLRGMQAFVTEHCGAEVVLEPEKSLYDYEPAAQESHECALEFLADLAAYFQLAWGPSRWVAWLGLRGDDAWSKRERECAWERWKQDVAPRITVRTLAELIAKRAPAQSLAPATVFGRACAPAGVFLGMCDMPEVNRLRVGPSTPFFVLLSSTQIRRLWKRVEWVSGVALPPVTEPSATRMRSLADALLAGTYVGAMCAGIVATAALWSVAGGAGAAGGGCALGGLVAAVGTLLIGTSFVDRVHDPLPENFVCFGDLARYVANRTAPSA